MQSISLNRFVEAIRSEGLRLFFSSYFQFTISGTTLLLHSLVQQSRDALIASQLNVRSHFLDDFARDANNGARSGFPII